MCATTARASIRPCSIAGLVGGFGLVAMRQRIAALSGTVQVESEPGGGTAISACVPTVPSLVRS